MSDEIRAKKHRLPEQAYWGDVRVFITARIIGGSPFQTIEAVEPQVEILRQVCEEYYCTVPIYCFMPDHLHLIIAGSEPRSRPKVAMDSFKHFSGHWFGQNLPAFDWQGNYFDEKIRKSEQWQTTARYIANNPVRAGIVQDYFDYPFTGAIGWDLRRLLDDMISY